MPSHFRRDDDGIRRQHETQRRAARRPSSARSSRDVEDREWRDLEAGGWPQDDEAGAADRGRSTAGAARPWAEVPAWPATGDVERQPRARSYAGRGPRSYTRPDARISEDVNERLTADASVDATDVEVEVRGGEVTLEGRVADREQKRRAEWCAERAPGVTQVINHLRVGDADVLGAGEVARAGDAPAAPSAPARSRGSRQASPSRAGRSDASPPSGPR